MPRPRALVALNIVNRLGLPHVPGPCIPSAIGGSSSAGLDDLLCWVDMSDVSIGGGCLGRSSFVLK